MKKIIVTTVMVFAFSFMNAQFKVGAHVGLPTGDIKDGSSVNLGADVAYLMNVAENFDVGVASGYTSYLGKDGADAVGFVPVAATGQFGLGENVFLAADLGYGIYVGNVSGAEGGFYYQPKLGYKIDTMELYVGYKGISVTGGTYSSVNVGVNFKF